MPPSSSAPKALLAAPGGWHLPHAARGLDARGALRGLWVSHKNSTGVSRESFRRCWPLHVAMKPFYQFAPMLLTEKAFYAFFPVWRQWLRSQPWPDCNVVQGIMGFATELFERPEAAKALKVVDCPNSHPVTYYGFWQRECDLWCPGETVPVPRWVMARMNREIAQADMVIVQSTFCQESMVLNGIPPEKVFINPMGVDSALFLPRTEVPSVPRFICVGTICLRKGHQYLFRAFERVRRELPAAELICVGDVKSDFRKEWPKWQGTFTHFEQLPQPEVAKLLRTCTAFVFPSQEEGIARAQVEALAAGLPVIGTHHGGASTLVNDGVEGFVVRGNDPAQMAAAMLRVARDPDLCARMGQAAYQKGAVRNTWQDYGDRLLAAYAERLNR